MLWVSLIESAPERAPEFLIRPEIIPKSLLWISAFSDPRDGEQSEHDSASEDDERWCQRLAASLKEKMQPEWRDVKGKGIEELIEQKERVKTLLRKYDKTFEQRFRRPPVRDEKEAMRSLYELYRVLKSAAGKAIAPSAVKDLPKDLSREQRLEMLLAEKAHLGRQLQAFSDNFERRHGRKVKYARDIAVVQANYLHYKKLKQEINELKGAEAPFSQE